MCNECGSDDTYKRYRGGKGDFSHWIVCNECGYSSPLIIPCDRCDSLDAKVYACVLRLPDQHRDGRTKMRRCKVRRCDDCARRLPDRWRRMETSRTHRDVA